MDWDRAHAELVLGDELGYVHFWNVANERCAKCEKLQRGHATGADPAAGGAPVRDLCLIGSELVASQGAGVDTWRVLRDVKYVETRGHTGAVIALVAVEPEFERAVRRAPVGNGARGGRAGARGGGGGVDGGGADASVIYSASLDGTIRAWDTYDMACLATLTESRSEISCLHHSALCEFLLTGHDDGTIR